MNNDKLDLITKLLAKAESTTAEEAEALTEHAERLMVKYGIEQAHVDEQKARLGEATEQIVHEKMSFTGAYARDIRELGAGVAIALGTCRPMFSEDRTGAMVLHLVGFESDVRRAQLLVTSLHVQAMVAMRAWWATNRCEYRRAADSEKRRARSGFVRGFGVGASDRVRESLRVIVEESGAGTELVLASRRDRVDAYVNDLSTRRARSRQGASAGAFVVGRKSGRQANTGGRALSGRAELAR